MIAGRRQRVVSMAEKTLLLRIHGGVQGVGFRDFVQRAARALGIRGWVRNRTDGTVEALIRGEESALHNLVQRCRVGPRAAQVERVDVSASEDEVAADFEMRPTL